MEIEVSLLTIVVLCGFVALCVVITLRKRASMVVPHESAPPPLQFFLKPELVKFNGKDDPHLYIGIRGVVYDVSSAPDFYGPGSAYHLFCGYDASVALAKLSFEAADLNSSDLSALTLMEQDALNNWEMKFHSKYPVVGVIVRDEQHRQEKLKLQAAEGREGVLKKLD